MTNEHNELWLRVRELERENNSLKDGVNVWRDLALGIWKPIETAPRSGFIVIWHEGGIPESWDAVNWHGRMASNYPPGLWWMPIKEPESASQP